MTLNLFNNSQSIVSVFQLNNLGLKDLAEELSGQVEGDMLIGPQEWASYNGRVDPSLRWRNKTVPYWINETFFSKKLTVIFWVKLLTVKLQTLSRLSTFIEQLHTFKA